MGKHFMSELGFTEEVKGSQLPNSLKNTEKNTKSVFPQPVAHNLQNVPNGMV